LAGGRRVCAIEKIITLRDWPIVSIETLGIRAFQRERFLAEIQDGAV
jgi:hypothetical protein